MLTEILVPIIAFLGLIIGNILAFIAPEEVHPYKKQLKLLKICFLVIIIITFILFLFKLPATLFYMATLIYLILEGIQSTSKYVKEDKLKNKLKASIHTLKSNWWWIIIAFLPSIISSII